MGIWELLTLLQMSGEGILPLAAWRALKKQIASQNFGRLYPLLHGYGDHDEILQWIFNMTYLTCDALP